MGLGFGTRIWDYDLGLGFWPKMGPGQIWPGPIEN